MFQILEGHKVFTVDLVEVPKGPITDGGDPEVTLYAQALDAAIREGTVKEPGKYAVEVNPVTRRWTIFTIHE